MIEKITAKLKELKGKDVCKNILCTECVEKYGNNCDNAQQSMAIDKCIEIVQEVAKVGGWIPCSERLPQEEEDVLMCVKEIEYAYAGNSNEIAGIYYWIFTGYNIDGEWYTTYCHGCKTIRKENEEVPYCPHEVIAWQPLPVPYQKGE